MVEIGKTDDLRSQIYKRIIQVILQVLVTGAILFTTAWRLDWFWGWFYVSLLLVSLGINGWILLKSNPEVVAERAETKRGRKSWDKYIRAVYALLAVPVSMVVAGLEARFAWTNPVPIGWHLLGIVLFLLSGSLCL